MNWKKINLPLLIEILNRISKVTLPLIGIRGWSTNIGSSLPRWLALYKTCQYNWSQNPHVDQLVHIANASHFNSMPGELRWSAFTYRSHWVDSSRLDLALQCFQQAEQKRSQRIACCISIEFVYRVLQIWWDY